ncbi:MAG: cytochrome c peroxidase, partial [Myxococcota bacterium]|nr:cytochrome c peroxidase [Myxococcota bacterium]
GATDGFSAAELEQLQTFDGVSSPKPDTTNQWADNPNAAHLGQYLFFDARLSGNGEFSCASCHQPEHGFSDNERLSEAAGTTTRHTPTILNSAYQDFFFWDGRADSQWSQALAPLEDEAEQATSRLAVAHLLQEDSELGEAYGALFGELPDLSDSERFPADGRPVPDTPSHPHAIAWSSMSTEDQEVINGIFVNVGKAMAAYERLLVQTASPFDDWLSEALAGNPASDLISEEAKSGLKLFMGQGNCHFCHSGPNFSNNAFHNIGLEDRDWLKPFDQGRYSGITALLDNPFNSAGRFSDDRETGALKIDHLVQSDAQLGAYKTPSLRNLSKTAPYMHGGHFETLQEVVESYSELDEFPSVGHREELMKKLEWSESEVSDMVAFLESLEGQEIDDSLLSAPASPIPAPQ